MFDLYRGEQVGEGNKSLALRLEFRAPDRTLTDEEVAERRDGDRARARGAGRAAACLGAARASVRRRLRRRASARASCERHPSLELTAVTARAERAGRHDELYPRYRVPLSSRSSTPTRSPSAPTPRSWPTRTRPPRRPCAQLRERGLKVVDLSADFRLDRERYERWYQPHEAPELLGEAVYGLPEAHREEIRGAELVAGPGCNSTAALLALLPLRGRIEDAVVDIKAGVSGAGREATEETHFVSAVDNVNAYKVEGHRHSAELEQELPGVRFSFVAHLLPIDQGILASCYPTPDEPPRRDEARALFEARYADEPFVEVVDEPAAHARRARHQPRAGARDRRGRAGDRSLRDRQPLEGRRRPGRAGPQPDARAARDRGARVSASSARAGSSRPSHARRAASDTELPAGFRAAGVAAGIKPEGLDVGVLVSDVAEPRSRPRASPPTRAWARR